MNRIIFLGAAFALLTLWAWPNLAGAASIPTNGQLAPEFALMDQNGNIQHLQDYRGKWLVLYFYPKDETPGCTTEACAFRDDLFKIRKLNAEVLGVSIDDASKHADFARNHHLPFPLLADKDGQVSARYGSLTNLLGFKLAKRNTFIIDPEGKIERVYEKVDADHHSEQVQADLAQLQRSSH